MSGSKGNDLKNTAQTLSLIELVALTMISRFYDKQKSFGKLKPGGVFPNLDNTLASVKVS